MLITPASSGTVIKSYILNKKFGTAFSKTIPMVFTEKYHDSLAPLFLVSIMLIFVDIFEVQLMVLVLIAIMLVIYLIIRKQTIFQKIINKTSKLKILNKFQENFLDYYNSLHSLFNKKPMIQALLVGTVSYFFDGLAIYLGFLALGIDFNFIESFVSVFVPHIIGAILLIPGGFGITETGMLGLFIQLGLPLSIAATAVLFTRLTGLWFNFVLGVITKIFIFKFSK
jgi:hypothetical protein